MTKGGPDTPFEVKLGRIRSASGHTRMKSFFKKLGRRARRLSMSARKDRSTGSVRRVSATQFHHRVIVKASIHKMTQNSKAAMRHHLDYIERDGAGEDSREAELYTDETNDLDRATLIERSEDDCHHFRFIVSPEDAEQMSDLKSSMRDLMAQMEIDLDTRLKWVAAVTTIPVSPMFILSCTESAKTGAIWSFRTITFRGDCASGRRNLSRLNLDQ